MFSFGLLILVLLFRPQGLLGRKPHDARLLEGVPRWASSRSARCSRCSLAFPAFASSYVLSVATLILYFAYTGQAWNVMMGFAGQLSLGHALYVGVGAYAAAALFFHYGIGPWAGCGSAIALCVALGARDRLPRLPLRHLGRLLRAAHHRLRRIHAHRLRPPRLDRRPGRPVPQGRAARPAGTSLNFRGPPAMYYYAMLCS